jgi:hypothetical protein
MILVDSLLSDEELPTLVDEAYTYQTQVGFNGANHFK